MQNRIIVLTLVCGLVSAFAIGGFAFSEIWTLTKQQALEKLASETRLMATQFAAGYRTIEEDLRAVASTPPVQGLVRAAENDGEDPKDGSTTEDLHARLATIFSSILSNRPEYIQFRLIEAQQDGRELVHVFRSDFGLRTVRPGKLKAVGSENYFAVGMSANLNQLVFSNVSFLAADNADGGQRVPILRGMLPVDDPLGTRFGVLVIDVDYKKMLEAAFLNISPSSQVIAVNGNGDYMENLPGEQGLERNLFIFGDDAYQPNSLVNAYLKSGRSEGLIEEDTSFAYFSHVANKSRQTSAALGIIQQISKAELFSNANKLGIRVAGVGLIIILVCAVGTAIAGREFIRPLIKLAKQIETKDNKELIRELPDDRNDEVGYLALAIKQRTQALIESKAEASALVDHVAEGVIMIDDQGRIEKFNPAAEQIFGFSQEEVLGKNVGMLMPEKMASVHDTFLTTRNSQNEGDGWRSLREQEGLKKNGETVPIELSVSTLTLNDRRRYIGVVRDITERRAIEQMRDQFVSTVSHEMRTPLTSIRGTLVLANNLSKDGSVPETIAKMMELALKNSERLNLLVNDILDLEKLRSGKMSFDMEPVDLNDQAQEAVDLNQHFAQGRNVSLETVKDQNAAVTVADKHRLQQVLSNLISNAAKFSPENGTVQVKVTANKDKVTISVIDTGMGIPESFQPYIFDPFSQAGGAECKAKGGTGLGLNITKRMVEGMEGNIGFVSEEGVGTTFNIEFPAGEGHFANQSEENVVARSNRM